MPHSRAPLLHWLLISNNCAGSTIPQSKIHPPPGNGPSTNFVSDPAKYVSFQTLQRSYVSTRGKNLREIYICQISHAQIRLTPSTFFTSQSIHGYFTSIHPAALLPHATTTQVPLVVVANLIYLPHQSWTPRSLCTQYILSSSLSSLSLSSLHPCSPSGSCPSC